jgi:Family of unknown function (DUF6519)/Periplasmic copper-binding protein (NosD)
MTTDISRKTFDPQRNTAWTTTMQGRVTTDAPQNEDRGIRDRRFRAETADLIGRCGYPAAIPTSFEISVSVGALMIGAGRYYVDGHLAENFGTGAPLFDEVLSELRGPDPVPFADQPFLPGITPPPPADGLHMVYLDVWQRDVTFLEDASILDPAVPVDTFARRQTVWQVRTFGPVDPATTCATPDADIPGRPEVIAPSAARLTTRANPAQAATNPCELPPGADYRGIDNRTYAYVIHDIAADGTPLVKFSRAHGVIATTILSQPLADTLEVTEVAKDDFLRFNPGDWVEITDEARLLSGTPGVMARVLSVDDPSNTITLEDPLPAGTVRLDGAGPDLDQDFHPVIRRWDQSGQIRDTTGTVIVDLDLPGASGLIPVPADGTSIALEDGVEAALSLVAGGTPRIGDSWTFIARYADSSVQELDAAPPEDFQHHYCRLALVNALGGVWLAPVVSDCRDPIDFGACCCSVIVFPGDDIQAAIDSLPPDFGGCVCLKAGLHLTQAAVVIGAPFITLHGESHGAVLRRETIGPVLQVTGTTAIEVQSIRFEHQAGDAPDGIVEVLSSTGVTITGCGFSSSGGGFISGVVIADGNGVTVSDNAFGAMAVGVAMPGRCDHIRIEHNRFALGNENAPALIGISAVQALGPIAAVGNRITGAANGISINDDPTGAVRGSLAAGSLVADNEIELVIGQVPANADALFGIDTASGDTTVRGNRISFTGGGRVGIRSTGVGVKLMENTVNADGLADPAARNIGIFVGLTEQQKQLTAQITVAANTIRGTSDGIAVRDVTQILISGNDIGPLVFTSLLPAVFLNQAIDARVTDNAIRITGSGLVATEGRNLRVTGNTIGDVGFGIGLAQEIAPAVSGNAITNALGFGAIAMFCIARCSFTENRVINAGSLGALPVGLGAFLILGEWYVEANEVMNTGIAVNGVANPIRALGITGAFVLEAQIESNLVTYSSPTLLPDGREDRALLLQGLIEITVILGQTIQTFGFPCQITSNKFVGKGNSALVEVRELPVNDLINLRFDRVFFNQNYVNHFGPAQEGGSNASVVLEGRAGVVIGNQVKTEGQIPSINMGNMQGTMVGNITTRGFANDPNFPANEADFNRQL